MKGLDWTGIEVKCLREAMLLAPEDFGPKVGCSPRAVRLWESKGAAAKLNPGSKRLLENTYTKLTDAARQRFEARLERTGRLPATTAEVPQAIQLGAMDSPPAVFTAFDRLREAIDRTTSKCTISRAALELIEERVADRVQAYVTAPPADALRRIGPDLVQVQAIASERQPAAVQARLSEASAVLGLLAADALMKLGEIDRANYWYGTARLAADDSPNRQLQATVRAQHAMLPYYYGDIEKTVVLARSSQSLLPGIACDATALAAAAEARALARLGDGPGAERAMNRARRLMDALPNNSGEEAFRFNARRLMLYLSGTLTYMGRIKQARLIQDEALTLYRESPVVIDPALIQFDAAVGHAIQGAVADGCQLAEETVQALPADHRTRIVATRAADVLTAVPARHQSIPAASSLRALVSAETKTPAL
ncbi:hypothetical protein ACWDYH_31450 [Nocardia goodfellowii]